MISGLLRHIDVRKHLSLTSGVHDGKFHLGTPLGFTVVDVGSVGGFFILNPVSGQLLVGFKIKKSRHHPTGQEGTRYHTIPSGGGGAWNPGVRDLEPWKSKVSIQFGGSGNKMQSKINKNHNKTNEILTSHGPNAPRHHTYWLLLIFIDFHWFSIIFIDFIDFIDFHWFSMIFIDFHWFSLIFIDFQWFSWISLISLISIDFHWFSLIFIDFY